MSRLLPVLCLALLPSVARSEPPKNEPGDPRLLNEGPVTTVAVSADGKTLAAGGAGRIVRLWDVASGKERHQLEHPGGVAALVFAPDGKTLVSAGGDRHLRLWDVAGGKQLRAFEVGESESFALAFSPDGKLLANGGDGIRIWDVAAGKQLHRLLGHDGMVFALAFSPDGKTLASGGEEQEVRLWNVADGSALRKWPQKRGVLCLAYSPDGKTLATGSPDGRVYLWAADNGKELARLGTGMGRPACLSLTFSADGKTLASGTAGAAPLIRRWDVATGKESEPRPGFRGAAVPVAFNAGSKALAEEADPLALLADVADPAKARTPPVVHLSADEFKTLWTDLAGIDAPRAAEAIFTLAADASRSLPFLKDNLKPEPPYPPFAQLLADLDDNRFAVRRKATEELQRMGKSAEAPLREALKGRQPLEVSRRIEQLLGRIEEGVFPPEQMRAERAVLVLEQLGTPEARQVLETLTKGAAEGSLTREAKKALERMKR